MTRQAICLLLFFCLWSGRALAVEAVVRSGEHGSFTRLVIDLPASSGWDLEQNGKQALLRIVRGVTSFDLSQVFSRIDQSRLEGLREGDKKGELQLDLACDCSVRAFLLGTNMLVIDIAPGADQPAGARENPNSEKNRLSFGSTVRERQSVDLPLFLPGVDRAAAQPVPRSVLSPRIDVQTTEAIQAAEERLLRQIGRAATQGLLNPSLTPVEPKPAVSTGVPTEKAKPAPQLSRPEAATEVVPLRATTSRDSALRDHLRLDGQGPTEAFCLPDTEFAINEWGSTDFAKGLAEWRSRLYGEFDRVNAEAAIGMARHYLHFGFGAEARRSVALQDKPYPILSILSHIVDGDRVYDAGPFLAQGACNGAVALWAVLALPDKEGRIDIDEQAVVRSFNGLPVHLRDRLGPELARRLSLFQYDDAAQSVMRRLDLLPKTETPEELMAQAKIAENQGATDIAQEARQSVVATGTVQSPLALADMIAGELAEGREIMPELADLAAAYAYERRSEPDATRLAWAEIQARAGAGQFTQAFQRLEALSDAERETVQSDVVYDLMRANASDTDFLTLLLPRLEQASALAPRTANMLAERLLGLGFPKEAAAVLRVGASGPEGRTRRVLRARIALDLGNPRQAEAEILGLAGSDADELRARARDQNASVLLLSPSDAVQQNRSTTLPADELEQPEVAENPFPEALARMLQPEAAETTDPEGAIARNRALLERSAEARQALDQFLSDYPPVQALPVDNATPSQ